jgi:pimeloyl-ACP methyl ester carboxylesterase
MKPAPLGRAMDPRLSAAGIAGAVVLATVLVVLLVPRGDRGPGEPPPTGFEPSPLARYDAELQSFDGTSIVFTVWRPADATVAHPVPLVLLAHGVTVDRRQPEEMGLVDELVQAGFGVVAPDLRGHGESGGLSRLSDPEHDVRDLAALLDWCHDHLDWAERQTGTGHDRDLHVGAWGYSLGGAMVHLSAALDGRIDALVPQNTMNDYLTILAPNGALKSVWATAFIAASRTGTDVGPVGHWRADPVFEQYYADAMANNRLPDEANRFFATISPYTYLDRVRVPALYIQGVPDMAFPLNEALRSRATLAPNAGRTEVFTWLGGHNVPGLQPAEGGSPCGPINGRVVAWFNETLRSAPPTPGHPYAFALDDGSCLRLEAAPTPTRNVTLPPVAMAEGAGSLLVPLLTADDALRLVGVPVLSGTATVAGVDDIFYVSLVAVSGTQERVLDTQVTPLRLPGPSTGLPFRLELNAVASLLKRGDQLALKIDRVNEWFVSNSGRTPGALTLTGATMALPLVT